MKKIILGLALWGGLIFSSTPSPAQTFEIALQQYQEETGTTTYEGQEVQPAWFRHKTKDVDTNGDGKADAKLEWNEFWIFGKRIWTGPVTSTPQ